MQLALRRGGCPQGQVIGTAQASAIAFFLSHAQASAFASVTRAKAASQSIPLAERFGRDGRRAPRGVSAMRDATGARASVASLFVLNDVDNDGAPPH